MCGTETSPGLRPGWRGRSGRASPALALPRAGAARRTLSTRAGPDIPVHKSRCAPAPPDSPPPPASGRPRPPCSPRRKALPPAAACRASGCPPEWPRCASRRQGSHRAARTAAPRWRHPVQLSDETYDLSPFWMLCQTDPIKKLYSGYFHGASFAYNRSIPTTHPNVK